MKYVVSHKDYDSYNIPFSVNAIGIKKMNNYLLTELAKRHPCFNNDFCFDCLLKISDKKLVFDVIVMNKMKYMEYKKRCRSFVLGLRFENAIVPYRFVSRKFIHSFTLGFLFIVIFLWFVFGCCIHLDSKFSKVNFKENQIDSVESQLNSNDYSNINENTNLVENNSSLVNTFLYEDFLQRTNDKNGKIKSFTWQFDGFSESFECVVKDIYPEDYADLIEGIETVVQYHNGKPEFCVKCKNRIEKTESNDVDINVNSNTFRGIENGFSIIRETLLHQNVHMKEEKIKPYSISFDCNDFSALKQLALICDENNFCINALKINATTVYDVYIAFSDLSLLNRGLSLETIKDYRKLFPIEIRLQEIDNMRNSKPENYEPVQHSIKELGSIGYEGGKKVIFFKDEKGKLSMEEH